MLKELNTSHQGEAVDVKLLFWDIPYLKNAFIDTVSGNRKDDISVGELGNESSIQTQKRASALGRR